MHCLPAVQNVEGTEDRGKFTTHESLGLRALLGQPHTEVAVHRVLQRDAISGSPILHLCESVVDTQRAWLAEEKLSEVRLAEPARETLGHLDANLAGQSILRDRKSTRLNSSH